MNGSKLIDEINRLFDQLVRDPWTRVPHPARGRGGDSELAIALPLAPGQRGDVSVAIEGRRLAVRAQQPAPHGGAAMILAEKILTLPEHTEVSGIEAHFEHATLHVRVHLRAARG